MKKIILLLCCILLLMGSTMCQKIVFSPQWIPQAQFAGYYVALEKGFYKELGLDVEIIHPTSSNSVQDKIKNKEVDIVSFQLVEALIKIDNGLDLVNIMQLFQNSPIVIVAQPQYTSLNQLQGKRVGGWKSGFNQTAMCLANDNLHHVDWVFFNNGINIFTSKAVDAILTMYYNEFFILTNSGQHLSEKNYFFLSDYEDYNIPEDGLYCLRDDWKKNKEQYICFVKATQKGWNYARQHRDETLQLVINIMNKNNIPCSKTHQQWMLDKVLDLQIDKATQKVSYRLDKQDFDKSIRVLQRNNFIKNSYQYEHIIQNINF